MPTMTPMITMTITTKTTTTSTTTMKTMTAGLTILMTLEIDYDDIANLTKLLMQSLLLSLLQQRIEKEIGLLFNYFLLRDAVIFTFAW